MILFTKSIQTLQYTKPTNKLYTHNNYNKKNLVRKKCSKLPTVMRVLNLFTDKVNIKDYPCLFLKTNRSKKPEWNKLILLRRQSNVWTSCSSTSPWFYFN